MSFQNGSSHRYSSGVSRRVRSIIIIMRRRMRTTVAHQGPPHLTNPSSTAEESPLAITPSHSCRPLLTTPPRTTLWRSNTQYNMYFVLFRIFSWLIQSDFRMFHKCFPTVNLWCFLFLCRTSYAKSSAAVNSTISLLPSHSLQNTRWRKWAVCCSAVFSSIKTSVTIQQTVSFFQFSCFSIIVVWTNWFFYKRCFFLLCEPF